MYLYNVGLHIINILQNVVDYPLLFSNVCLKKCVTPLYLKSVQSRYTGERVPGGGIAL